MMIFNIICIGYTGALCSCYGWPTRSGRLFRFYFLFYFFYFCSSSNGNF